MGCTGSRGKHGDGIKPLKIPETIYKYGTDDKDALAPSLKPKFDPEYYKLQCDLYFTHLESGIADRVEFYCASGCPRWEWPPWDCLTGLGFVNIMTADAFDRDETACIVVDRTHKFFDVQPFGRSVVTFYYGDDIKTRKNPIKIYEEFTFNDFGQVTFIEAWSAVKGEYLPVVDDNGWPPEDVPVRLSYHIPGLGSPTGTNFSFAHCSKFNWNCL